MNHAEKKDMFLPIWDRDQALLKRQFLIVKQELFCYNVI